MIASKKSLGLLFTTAILALSLTGCKSKQKVEGGDNVNPDASNSQQSPGIDSAPMSFDAQGSDSGKISGLETVNFPYDKNTLTADAKQKIQSNVDWMKSHGNTNIQIEGHCDAKGSIEYNLSLGERRAQAVKTYMVGLGISGSRLSVISYGKEKPVASGDSESDYARNRRANFVPVGQ